MLSVIQLRAIASLIPYTTLFRSFLEAYVQGDGDKDHHHRQQEVRGHGGRVQIGPHGDSTHDALAEHPSRDDRCQGVVGGIDRKSTRLNSSHVSISYAVFCLNKKK